MRSVMGNKIFKKEISRACKHCIFSHDFGSQDEVLCQKRGAVNKDDCCRKYKYDVLKRKPDKATLSGDYSQEDFLL